MKDLALGVEVGNIALADDIVFEPGEVGAVLELILRDPEGKIAEEKRIKCESFLYNFLVLLYVQACGFQLQHLQAQVRDTSGRYYWPVAFVGGTTYAFNNFYCSAAAGDATLGILVGTGTTAPTLNDYKMESLIAHGTGAGQLQYGAVAFGAPSTDGVTSQFTITRNFANSSGAQVVVKEIGLAVIAVCEPEDASGVSKKVLTIRDVITEGIAVPNGSTLTANYRITAQV